MKDFLPSLLQAITGKARHRPEIKWDKRIWIANIFRAWEKVFGIEIGIKKEASTSITTIDGKVEIIREFYTLEAKVVYIETIIRYWLSLISFEFDFDTFKKLDPDWAIRGAIALDASASGTSTSTTPLAFNHTCTGSNLLLAVGVGVTATSPTISAPTYNAVAMSLVGSQRTNVANMAALYFLVAPATGSNSVSAAFGGTSPFCNATAVSYSGASQTGQPDASGGGTGASAPSIAVTTVADNCWVVYVVTAVTLSGANQTSRGAGVLVLTGTTDTQVVDNNAAKHPAGSVTAAWAAGSTTWAGAGGSIAPAVAATVKQLSALGVG